MELPGWSSGCSTSMDSELPFGKMEHFGQSLSCKEAFIGPVMCPVDHKVVLEGQG